MPVCDLANASQAVIDARLSQWRIQQLPQILERHIRMFQTYLCDLSETVRQRTKSSGLFDPLDIFHLSDSRMDVVDGLLLQQTCCRRAFTRGAFLAAGSISDPNKNYHLEIVCKTSPQALQLQEIMKGFAVDAKIVERKRH